MKPLEQIREDITILATPGVQQLDERFMNILPQHKELRDKHFPAIFDMVHKAYESVGGIKGAGFSSVDDMKKNIHMVKVHHREGKIHAVALYKDRAGRKAVALATDGSDEGRHGATQIVKNDMHHGRSWKEVSSKSLSFMKKHLNVSDLAIHPHEVKKLMPDSHIEHPVPDDDHEAVRHPELKNHFYRREIGGEVHTKLAVGTPNVKLF